MNSSRTWLRKSLRFHVHIKETCAIRFPRPDFFLCSLHRGDQSSIACNMAVLHPKTEAVVFSIDGSFLASYSLRGVDPKIRGGAVDVVR